MATGGYQRTAFLLLLTSARDEQTPRSKVGLIVTRSGVRHSDGAAKRVLRLHRTFVHGNMVFSLGGISLRMKHAPHP